VSAGSTRTAARSGPFGSAAAGSQSRTVVTPGGSTVQAGRVGGVSTGPLGGARAAGASGVRVTTPSGQTYSHASRGRAAAGPYGGTAATGTSRTTASGPFGAAGVRRSGGAYVR
jgi:hypothetical protein